MGTPGPETKSAFCVPGQGVAIDDTVFVSLKRLV